MPGFIIDKISKKLDISRLAQNLKFLMDKARIDSATLSLKTDIATTTLNSLKRGVGNPTFSTLQILADFFNVSISELMEVDITNNNHSNKSHSSAVEIPMIEIDDVLNFLNNVHTNFKRKIMVEIDSNNEKNTVNRYFSIQLPNNALMPVFEKDTIFVLSHELTPVDGDLVLVQFNHYPPCFRKIFMEEEMCFFSQVSELIGKEITKSKNFKICGTVIKAIQNFYP